MSKLKMKKLIEDVILSESRKTTISTAQVKEVLTILSDMVVNPNGGDVLTALVKNGERRAKKAVKLVPINEASSKKAVKKGSKKVPRKKVAKKSPTKLNAKKTSKRTKKVSKPLTKKPNAEVSTTLN